jgi:hypothetical protein
MFVQNEQQDAWTKKGTQGRIVRYVFEANEEILCCGECPLVIEWFNGREDKRVVHCQAMPPEDSRFVDDFDFHTRSEGCPLIKLPINGVIVDLDKLPVHPLDSKIVCYKSDIEKAIIC